MIDRHFSNRSSDQKRAIASPADESDHSLDESNLNLDQFTVGDYPNVTNSGKSNFGKVQILSRPYDLLESQIYVDLLPSLGFDLKLKCEGFNFAGSLKMRAAARLISGAEERGEIDKQSVLIESSSGNLGLALAMIAASKGMRFVCVTDPRCNVTTMNLLRALGAEVVVVSELDCNGGFLQTRMDYVRARCAEDRRYVWLNQYANPSNWIAHYESTAPSIAEAFPDLDLLFVGVGTGGTAMGCARYFRDNGDYVRVIAVDAEGSVSFGGTPGRRVIPGIGASIRPGVLDPQIFADVVHVREADSIRWCHDLARLGFLFGGSTGTIVSGAIDWLSVNDPHRRLKAVAIAPDLADRYFDTIFDDGWIAQQFNSDS
ncbi:2,3-diaminopropionate biosynthesis protein SbnA [Rhodococcus sp. NPDC060176]|uniref:2,3-diaminopropionate biosynthesis protein SbnA n=1 Tax=Rhodococcus sp. NPDC060176 TaxID=3347062 RepID=UPI00365E723A